jgi:LysM repeat protein
MKKLLLIGIILFNVLLVSAQHLKIQKDRSRLYITHKVTAKESLYSLGRMYNLSPKEIAAANKLKPDAGLQIGEEIKIPLKKDNFVQSTPKTKKGLQPVYHTIKKGENLSRLSKAYNKVKEADLKKWNSLSKNTIKTGQDVIVGYVRVNKAEAETKEQVASKPKVKTDSSKVVRQLTQADMNASSVTQIGMIKDTESTVVQTKGGQTADNNADSKAMNTSPGESFFAANYSVNAANAQEKKINGSAATFKSTSGWSDNKYYILLNEVAPETIVKVTVNGKFIYAKVLERLPDLRDNKGIICRLSNAAASALGVTEAKFDVEIAYYE